MLNWANRFGIFCFLDNQDYRFEKPAFDFMLAASPINTFTFESGNNVRPVLPAEALKGKWLFGHLCYPDSSRRADATGFPDSFFFEPGLLIVANAGKIRIDSMFQAPSEIFGEICMMATDREPYQKPFASIHARYSRQEYLGIIRKLLKHIQRGDCYEINFCQEFYATGVSADPVAMFLELSRLSPNPFSALYKNNNSYCLCASPERFIRKEGQILTSQPIKGTIARDLNNDETDSRNRELLANSAKDKSENVMVVDMVRNDISRVCKAGSVHVQDLFGIYRFPQVYQMISTIQGTLRDDTDFNGIIHACFPMGSMTGAPKVRVMQLIDDYETTPRGLFSGTIGYIDPQGDFDFNVVIRSLFYNQDSGYLMFKAGGGITTLSNPEDEYEESILKASAIRQLFL